MPDLSFEQIVRFIRHMFNYLNIIFENCRLNIIVKENKEKFSYKKVLGAKKIPEPSF